MESLLACLAVHNKLAGVVNLHITLDRSCDKIALPVQSLDSSLQGRVSSIQTYHFQWGLLHSSACLTYMHGGLLESCL